MPVTVRVAAKELPSLTSFSAWDSVQLVKSAISAMESTGYLEKAALVVDAMGRDDRISGVMLTRAGAIPALPLRMEPRGDGRQKTAVAREAETVFEDMFPDHALTELLHWGIMLGVGVGQLVWTTQADRWTCKLRVWHPRFVRYDYDREGYEVTTQNGPVQVTAGDGQWLLFAPWGVRRGWMQSKVRSLHVPWLLRQWALRDWARYAEVQGNPTKLALMPSSAQEDDKRRFIQELANMGAEAVVALPRTPGGTENDSFDVKMLEATSNSWETFRQLIDKADACVAISLLGQNLTTEVKGGSYAAAVMHQMIRNDVLQSDAERLGQCLRDQALSWWATYNFGDKELAPMPIWQTQPESDVKAVGEGMKALGEGILALKTIGAKPDIDTILDDNGVATSGPSEDVPLPAQGAPGQPGGVPPGQPRPTQPVATASRFAQLAKLNPDVPAAAIEGQLYVDDLGKDSTKEGAKVVAPDLKDLLQLIDDAKDFDGLRSSLLAKYGRMSKKKLARLMEQALVMAELAGRHSVLQELADQVKRGE